MTRDHDDRYVLGLFEDFFEDLYAVHFLHLDIAEHHIELSLPEQLQGRGAVLCGHHLVLFGLEYAGLVEVKWNLISERYDDLAGWLGDEFSSFRSFVSGRIPVAGSALAGAVIGFTRK